MDPNSERFAKMRATMDKAERAEFDEYVTTLPDGSNIFWRCTAEPSNPEKEPQSH